MPVNIRDEVPSDAASIDAVIRAAFLDHAYTSHTEQFVVAALRRAGALRISLVAELKGVTIGHVAVSPVAISSGVSRWYGLGPIAVVPECQGGGIGSELLRAALTRLQEIGAAGCVLLGNPRFYGRFGFRAEPGLVLPNFPPELFQALSFGSVVPHGVVSYHEAFDARA